MPRRHGRRRPATHDFPLSHAAKSRGWPAFAGHDTEERCEPHVSASRALVLYQAAKRLTVVPQRHPRESGDPCTIGPRFRGDDAGGAAAAMSRTFGGLVLPVPDGPGAMQFWRFSIHSQRASQGFSALLGEGRTLNSDVPRLLVCGNRARPGAEKA